MTPIKALYEELDHLPNSQYIITRAVRAAADTLSDWAANEPDTRQQRRTSLGNAAHELRMLTAGK